MLRLNEIHTYYGASHVLQGVTLHVPAESVVALLGRNGMGKTTTIHSIIGFNRPHSGEIIFNGKDITCIDAYRRARMGIALVPQGRRIFPSLTVQENLTLGRRKDDGKLNYNLETIYHIFPVLRERAKQHGLHLSGGEQQMVAIGRALLTNPDLILMDEPFEGLAPPIVEQMAAKLAEIKKLGLAMLLVEHNVPEALKLADYIYVINKGKIIYHGSKDEFAGEQEVKKRFLLI